MPVATGLAGLIRARFVDGSFGFSYPELGWEYSSPPSAPIKPSLPIEVRQVMFPRPFLDPFDCPIRPAVAVAIAAVACLQKASVVAFQLTVAHDAHDAHDARLARVEARCVRQIESAHEHIPRIDTAIVVAISRFTIAGVTPLVGAIADVVLGRTIAGRC